MRTKGIFKYQRIVIGLTAATVSSVVGGEAFAVEYAIPYLQGATIGVPLAAPPPPGFYAGVNGLAQIDTLKDGKGGKLPIKISLYRLSFAGLYVHDTKILGGVYSAFVRETVVSLNVATPGGTNRQVGSYNPIISPINISWALAPSVFVSLGESFYLPIGTYQRSSPVNISNNFATFEQTAAISYLTPTFDASLTAFYDKSTTNYDSNSAFAPRGKYKSGDVLNLDFSMSQQFGALRLGVGGYYAKQVTDDKADNQVVPATPANGYGNRAETVAIGPTVSFLLGKTAVSVYYTRDLYTRNYISGNTFWGRAAYKF